MISKFFDSIKTIFFIFAGLILFMYVLSIFTREDSNNNDTVSSKYNKRPRCDYSVSNTIISNILNGESIRMENGMLVDNETICDKNFQYVISIKNGYMNGKVWKYRGNVLDSITEYSKTNKNGIEVFFYKNGNVYKEFTYQNNKLNGLVSEYRDNGTLFMQTNYKNDKLDGKSFVYSKNGSLLYTAVFNNNNVTNIECVNGYKPNKSDYKAIQSGNIINCQ